MRVSYCLAKQQSKMKNHNQKRILFLLKKDVDSAGGAGSKAGLFNAANFIADYLSNNQGVQAFVDTTVDGNTITQNIKKFQPNVVVLEAIWCPPYKITQLVSVYPEIQWVVRVHSKIPFLANEGMAIDWLEQYSKIKNTTIAFNSKAATSDFNKLGYESIYLPNIYYPKPCEGIYDDIDEGMQLAKDGHAVLNVGCFGALRPMKNHLNQAIAAIEYANQHNKKLLFHINVGQDAHGGEEILKNLRALFNTSDVKHSLVEWPWYDHNKFRHLISKMHFGMQVSLSESFNLVTADFVNMEVPIVASKDIDWMPMVFRADPTSTDDIREKIKAALLFPKLSRYTNSHYLEIYNKLAEEVWSLFLKFNEF